MDKLLSGISITTLILLYLFIGGGLYLIGYWSIYSFDFIGLIGIMDIPKAFIKPFSITIGMYSIGYIIGIIVSVNRKKDKIETLPKDQTTRNGILMILLVLGLIPLSYIFSKSENFWYMAMTVTVIITMINITDKKLFDALGITSIASRYSFIFFIILPIICFMSGKMEGAKVYGNSKIKCINSRIIHIKNATLAQKDSVLKYLGFLGDKVIVSSLDNKRIIVLNHAALDGLELYDTIIKK